VILSLPGDDPAQAQKRPRVHDRCCRCWRQAARPLLFSVSVARKCASVSPGGWGGIRESTAAEGLWMDHYLRSTTGHWARSRRSSIDLPQTRCTHIIPRSTDPQLQGQINAALYEANGARSTRKPD